MRETIDSCFPAYMNLKDRTCLIVGGGKIAWHKTKILLDYCSQIRIVAESFNEQFKEFQHSPSVRMIRKSYEAEDLNDAALVISATAHPKTDLQIFQDACERNIPVNTVDQPKLCTFIFPAIIHDGPLNIAISTNGASPSAARYLKKLIRSDLPDDFRSILEFLGSVRPTVIERVHDEKKRALFFRSLFDECLHEGRPLSNTEFEERLNSFLENGCSAYPATQPQVILAGAGCGSASLMTREVRDLILQAPVVFYDDLIDQSIIDLISGTKIRTGKRKGKHSHSQDEINRLLIEAAHQYPWVLRLKGGDPFVFGRGMEEAEALENAGIQTRVLSGLTSCIAVPERMSIPVTDRRMAGSFLVISASSKDPDRLFSESPKLLAQYSGTLVILMGFTRIREISRALIEAGKDPKTPAATISSPSISKSIGISSDLAHLAEDTQNSGLCPPGILVIGDTVRFMKNADHTVHSHALPKIGICATERFFRKVADHLPYGIESAALMTSKIEALHPDLQPILQDTQGENWLVFLSETGSELFLQELRKQKLDVRSLHTFKIACIGEASAKPFTQIGLFPDLIPARATSRKLAEELAALQPGPARVITFRTAQADGWLEQTLKQNGLNVSRCDLYSLNFTPAASEEPFDSTSYCGFCFGSRFSAQTFGRMMDAFDTRLRQKILDKPAFCLSEQTGSVLKEIGFTTIHQPYQISANDHADLIARTYHLKSAQSEK